MCSPLLAPLFPDDAPLPTSLEGRTLPLILVCVPVTVTLLTLLLVVVIPARQRMHPSEAALRILLGLTACAALVLLTWHVFELLTDCDPVLLSGTWWRVVMSLVVLVGAPTLVLVGSPRLPRITTLLFLTAAGGTLGADYVLRDQGSRAANLLFAAQQLWCLLAGLSMLHFPPSSPLVSSLFPRQHSMPVVDPLFRNESPRCDTSRAAGPFGSLRV